MTGHHNLCCVLILTVLLAGCGFQPLYATPKNAEGHPLLRQIEVGPIVSTRDAGEGNLAVQPILRRALENRLIVDQQVSDTYDLTVTVTPIARRLNVQVDASVTRFNYELRSGYELTHRQTRATIRGNPTAVASFNQVASNYSSLFAEREAVEKASQRLAEEIERDILFKADILKKAIDERKGGNGPAPEDIGADKAIRGLPEGDNVDIDILDRAPPLPPPPDPNEPDLIP